VKIYFQIQWKIINRHIKEAGFNVVLAWLIALITFIGLSIGLFTKYEYPEYLFSMLPIFLSIRLADLRRKEFIIICYGNRRYYLIRVLENVLISIPFLIFLVIFQHYLISILLAIFALTLTIFQWQSKFHFIIPTPFQKNPYEFPRGFRKTILLIGLVYSIAIIAVRFENYNLGLFSLILGFLTSMSYYSFTEDRFFVWLHIEKPKGFLLRKIKVAVLCNGLLYLPLIMMMSFFFYENIYQILILWGAGNLFLLYIIFVKYSAFPNKVGLKESILLAVTIYFPPLLLITIPYFYFQSLRSLSKFLK